MLSGPRFVRSVKKKQARLKVCLGKDGPHCSPEEDPGCPKGCQQKWLSEVKTVDKYNTCAKDVSFERISIGQVTREADLERRRHLWRAGARVHGDRVLCVFGHSRIILE